jgi:hypothetical protein
MTTLISDSIENPKKQDNRKPPRDVSSTNVPSDPIRPPFLSDGLEQVRGIDC